VRETGRVNRVAVVETRQYDVSRAGGRKCHNNLEARTRSTEPADVDRSARLAVLRQPKIISLVFEVFI